MPEGEAGLSLLRDALRRVRAGDFAVDLPAGRPGSVMGDITEAFNAVVQLNRSMADEAVRVERVVGREGRMGERLDLGAVQGDWARSTHALNALIGDLVQPTTEVARVLIAVANGDLT
jgi:hypothetical protein